MGKMCFCVNHLQMKKGTTSKKLVSAFDIRGN